VHAAVILQNPSHEAMPGRDAMATNTEGLTPRCGRRNSTRDREKAELLALRRLTSELEAHLRDLRAPHDGCRQQRQSVSDAWKRVARRQEAAKRTSEAKNRALVAQVQYNADWIHRLWELLRETRSVPRPLTNCGIWNVKTRDAAVFHSLKRANQLTSDQALQVFAAHDISLPAPGGLQERWGYAVDVDRGCARLVGVRHVPFDAHMVSAAIWAALSDPGTISGCPAISSLDKETHDSRLTHATPMLQVAERSTDTFAMKMDFKLPTGDCTERSCSITSHVVAQKLLGGEERGVSLFLWRMRSALGDVGCHRIESDDVMWVAVSSCPAPGIATNIAVITQTQVHSPGIEHHADLTAVRNRFQTIMIAEVEPCVTEILDTTETILVKSATGQQSSADTDTLLFTV
jgi:hypothetical protein